MVPVTRAVTGFLAVDDQYQFPGCDYAAVLCGVGVRFYLRAGRVGCEQHLAIRRLQAMRVKRPGKRWQGSDEVGKAFSIQLRIPMSS